MHYKTKNKSKSNPDAFDEIQKQHTYMTEERAQIYWTFEKSLHLFSRRQRLQSYLKEGNNLNDHDFSMENQD